MVQYDEFARESLNLPLNEKFYDLGEDEIAFYKTLTGIASDDELKQHIISVQHTAYTVFPYPCIRWFTFARLQITQQEVYPQFLKLGKERPGAIYLEMACCFGADVRKAVADGYPVESCVATDLRPDFWQLGYKLFKDSSDKFPVPFLAGDAFDSSFLSPSPIALASSPPVAPPPHLTDLQSLTPLAGHVSAIHATNFFHLFDEPNQRALAARLAGLLDPRPGSLIFGSHVGMAERGTLPWRGDSAFPMFCHSPASWRAMWEDVFGDIPVRVDATVVEYPGFHDVKLDGAMRLMWSVTRV